MNGRVTAWIRSWRYERELRRAARRLRDAPKYTATASRAEAIEVLEENAELERAKRRSFGGDR